MMKRDTKQVAQMGLLAEPKPRWAAFSTSLMFQFALIGLLSLIPVVQPAPLHQRTEMVYYKVETTPPPVEQPRIVHRPRVTAPPPELRAEPLPAPVEVLPPPPEVKPLEPRPEPPKLVRVVRPVDFTPPVSVAPVAKPARQVETNVFEGSSATPTINRPAREVQTGGFGDPNGLPGQARGGSHGNVARLGSFDLPAGPGYGNGTGGAKGVRGVVASAGFGNGVATQSAAPANGTVRTSGFDQQQLAAAPREKHVERAPAVVPVEILFKPRPEYTDEARRLKLEGEVLLEVVFTAQAEVRVNRVIRGLGHGLDEAAERAAQQIRFKPAMSGGAPVDFPATVHIEFALAY